MWKTAWRRYSGGEDDEGWKELLDRKESKRKKKPLIERPQKPTPLQLGEMLNRRFVKERVFECCVCSEFSVAENAYENEELPTCSECRRQVCDQIGKCYENCHYCGAVLCKVIPPSRFCALTVQLTSVLLCRTVASSVLAAERLNTVMRMIGPCAIVVIRVLAQHVMRQRTCV